MHDLARVITDLIQRIFGGVAPTEATAPVEGVTPSARDEARLEALWRETQFGPH